MLRTPHDVATQRDGFLQAVLDGLGRRPRSLPCRFFYDERGSQLFEAICECPEYYLTRTELAIMEADARAMAEAIGPRSLIVELGSGSGAKTSLLLKHLEQPVGYMPVDISLEALSTTLGRLAEKHPDLVVEPVCTDFSTDIPRSKLAAEAQRTVVYFPGSTVGNCEPEDAVALLQRIAAATGPGGGLLVGFDLVKDVATLEAAYNDAQGITARFNGNLLVRMASELGADVDPDGFQHRSVWNPKSSAVESFLVSRKAQVVVVAGQSFAFEAGEVIHTESSYKYSVEQFEELGARAGMTLLGTWLDDKALFAVQMFEVD